MRVCGIDPGLGVKSPTGVSVFDSKSREIVLYRDIYVDGNAPLAERIQVLCGCFTQDVLDIAGPMDLFSIEYFVMRGKGGESLQRLVGGLMSQAPVGTPWKEVQNSIVKKVLGSKGGATKEEVAAGVLEFFIPNKDSAKQVKELIKGQHWDTLDSLAIGITALKKD